MKNSCLLKALLTVLGFLIPSMSFAGIDSIRVGLSDSAERLNGRLYVVFSRSNEEEPRLAIGDDVVPARATPFFALDVDEWDGSAIDFVPSAGYPFDGVNELEEGQWYVQALYDTDAILSEVNSPGAFYSAVTPVLIDSSDSELELELDQQIPAETLPEDTALLKFVKIRSDLLSEFYGTDVFLRASVLLPSSYSEGSDRRYPVLYHVAGMNGRYTRASSLLQNEEFLEYWESRNSTQAVMVFLDGESPFGDSYQVNSAVSGPYADANFTELFPYLAENFPIADQSSNRFVTGCSTGGWVSMALQILYPDYFNGAWSLSPDSPSFRAFQLVDIYNDSNGFMSPTGMMRPSSRDDDGDPRFSIADEVRMEAAIGRGDSFVTSGMQWGAWNAVYGQPDENGNPIPIWDQESGEIDPEAAAGWASWDLEYYVRENWSKIGPSLNGKLHFWMGDMDNYYLNNGLRNLEQAFSEMEAPGAVVEFNWIPNHGHCGFGTKVHYIDVLDSIARRASATN
ncbi:MAG: alpha/beta hydrolase-fold protein [Proteobacteria bacterium]|nr:alpha/beta hydrolase-fold protein [Pseudomonadota bacterium]